MTDAPDDFPRRTRAAIPRDLAPTPERNGHAVSEVVAATEAPPNRQVPGEPWQPHGGHWKYLEAMLGSTKEPTVEELAKACGAGVETIRYWRQDPGFRAWMDMMADIWVEAKIPFLLAKLLRLSESDDEKSSMAAIKMLLAAYKPQRFGGGAPRRGIGAGEGEAPPNINDQVWLEVLTVRFGLPKDVAVKLIAGKMQILPSAIVPVTPTADGQHLNVGGV